MMSLLEPPLKLRLFWDCKIEHCPRGYLFGGVAKKTFSLSHVISYSELVQKICIYQGLDQTGVKMRITMRHPDVFGSTVNFSIIEISDDDDMQNLWDHACAFKGQAIELHIQTETVENIVPIQENIPNVVVQPHVTNVKNVMGLSSAPAPPSKVTNVISSTDSNCQQMSMGCVPPTHGSRGGSSNQQPRNVLFPNVPENIPLHVTLVDKWVANEPCWVGAREAMVDGLRPTSDMDGLVDSDVPDVDEDDLDADESNGAGVDDPGNVNPARIDIPQGIRWGDESSNICINEWSECNSELRNGMRFVDKKQVVYAVRKWSVQRGREFQVTESKGKSWVARCKNSTPQNSCPWRIRVIQRAKRDMWQITRWFGEHICTIQTITGKHRNMTSKFIASHVLHLVEQDSETRLNDIIDHVIKTLHYTPSYKKVWHARIHAIELLYGDWPSSFVQLPKFMLALQDSNSGTVVEWRHLSIDSQGARTFGFLFWAFGPSIKAFTYMKPIISVDGTYLRGIYKGKILIAIGQDANSHILPLAFAVVDEETNVSWDWFLSLLRNHVIRERQVCLISDRHEGILNTIRTQPQWQEPMTIHRFCLRHVRSNFNARFKNRRLEKLMYIAGVQSKVRKFNMIMNEIKEINREAFDWLMEIPVERWTLAHDGGYRCGNMHTNLSESFNSVVKGIRTLPIKVIVESTFKKSVRYFNNQRAEANQGKHRFPSTIWDKFVKNELKGRTHTVLLFNESMGVFSVRSPHRDDGKGNNIHDVNLSRRTCTCHKFEIFGIPCSHAFAACQQNGWDPGELVSEFNTMRQYIQTYAAQFMPISHEDYWRETLLTVTPHPPSFKSLHRRFVVRRGTSS